MTNEKHAVDRTRGELGQEIHAYKNELLAIADDLERQAVGQSRRCIYNPVQIAECGGPCEQIGPEACDCGALWIDQNTEQPVVPTDEELWAVGDKAFRALCVELTKALDKCQRSCGDQPESFLVWKARAALAEQPVGPTDEELRELRRQHDWPVVDSLLFSIARAVLRRWGQS